MTSKVKNVDLFLDCHYIFITFNNVILSSFIYSFLYFCANLLLKTFFCHSLKLKFYTNLMNKKIKIVQATKNITK